MKYDNTICPFCWGKLTISKDEESNNVYTCNECKRTFDDDDFEHELLRQKISSICSAKEATEDNPLKCDIEDYMDLRIEGIDEQAQGLCEMLKPKVSEIFQDSEGIVWFRLADVVDENMNPDTTPIELDSIITISLRQILKWLEEYYGIETLGRMDENSNLIDK